ncbi:amidohydrolase [Pandoraea thiooxydans]|uniref:Peptidase M20 dimerisation domain-containing protein n=1 Tax=Pandoraea thiooxydans TaxID=445709 RepID=A0A0G3EJ70_9BURK|nr:M20 aminoacylase family protein [Pandoraea thiooxydans]AKJ67073.1 peptidase M20 [Pandoraea thiooxydans]APR94010.1 amidohydrolase [Pandoraea thiooxydans]
MDKRLSQPSPMTAINQFHGDLIAIRHDLHAHPELGFEELRTARIVAETLERFGIEVHRGIGRTGVVGVIPGRATGSGRMIGLRADMDALPIVEENEFGHRSTRHGLMHGCGHDGHTTMLLGAARYLAQTRNFDGTVALIFQPGEEGCGGASAMLEDGLFERFPCDEVYGMHNWPSLPPGKIGINPGPMMSACDRVEIRIEGRGGHGAHPYMAVDPIVAAGHIIAASQTIVARNVNPFDSAVVSLCAVEAGNAKAFNVIPHTATLIGTVRTFNPLTQDMVEARLRTLCTQVAMAFGATATVEYVRMNPATINTPHLAQFVADVAQTLVGADNVIRDLPPSMGSEDFAFMLQRKPGAYVRIGQGGLEGGCVLHNTRYDFNDDILPLGSALFAALAERSMPLTAP